VVRARPQLSRDPLDGAAESMANSPNRVAALIGTAVWPAVSWLFAAGYVAWHDWFGVGDLSSFAFWSTLATLPGYPVLRLYDRRAHAWGTAAAFGAAVSCGLIAAVLWTLVVATILGGWIGAFSFPVFLCWLGGALAGFVACALARRPRTWPVAPPAVAIPFVAAAAVLRIVFAQPADLLIHVSPGITPQQVETIWTEVLGTPSPTGVGHAHIEGVQTVSRYDGDGEVRIRVSFFPGTSEARRAVVVAQVLSSPLVARTSDLEAGTGSEFGARALPDTPQ
jgi:hypothetical protein